MWCTYFGRIFFRFRWSKFEESRFLVGCLPSDSVLDTDETSFVVDRLELTEEGCNGE